MPDEPRTAIRMHLDALYGDSAADTARRLDAILERFSSQIDAAHVPPAARLTERDAFLITYAEQVRDDGEPPLRTLRRLLDDHLEGVVSGVHLLPFFPATSDDGFAVADYLSVDEGAGSWSDIEALAEGHRLMFDAVINHVSASHPWFRAFLRGDEPYVRYFITEDPSTDLSDVVRPRATPLLTPFETARGTQHVWTTFSADQIDLNYAEPRVLLDVVEVLLEYVRRGAEILRLDAVTFLWKEVGTTSVHHPNTHRVLKLLRAVMEAVAPRVVLLTETNVPHRENVSYFGTGRDEAQMVYNFALPPLVLNAFQRGDAGELQRWARSLETPTDETAFFNFLASHDGIGLRPVEEILGEDEVAALVARVRAHGGLVSTKRNRDGTESPYELNVSWFDALSDPGADEPIQRQVDRFATAHAIMLSLAGVPGIYIHSLLGSRSAHDEVDRTGRARSINRAKFRLPDLELELADERSLRSRVLRAFRALLRVRRGHRAFAPGAAQEVLDTPPGIFGLRRSGRVTCLHNVSDMVQSVPADVLPARARDLISGAPSEGARDLELAPWAYRWLEAT